MPHTGFVYDSRFLEHDTGNAALTLAPNDLLEPDQHIESPVRIRRTVHLLEQSGLTAQLHALPCPTADIEDVAVYHLPEYIDDIAAFTRKGGGFVTHSTPLCPDSYEIALLAVGGGLEAVRAVVQGDVTSAYAMLRPPGHHALEAKAMGFCVFNNIVIAAKLAQQRWGIDRVAIVDWDVHHGNGTQAAFYDDPSVLFISLHQDDLFPRHSGLVKETGSGDGTGMTVNIPLPAGTGDAGYRYAFERVVTPIIEQFAPAVIGFSRAGRQQIRSARPHVRVRSRLPCHGAGHARLGRPRVRRTSCLVSRRRVQSRLSPLRDLSDCRSGLWYSYRGGRSVPASRIRSARLAAGRRR